MLILIEPLYGLIVWSHSALISHARIAEGLISRYVVRKISGTVEADISRHLDIADTLIERAERIVAGDHDDQNKKQNRDRESPVRKISLPGDMGHEPEDGIGDDQRKDHESGEGELEHRIGALVVSAVNIRDVDDLRSEDHHKADDAGSDHEDIDDRSFPEELAKEHISESCEVIVHQFEERDDHQKESRSGSVLFLFKSTVI